ncbi:MAG: HEAT repeat domain-containing protein, partial [Planctomycetes bacterium]|nr:HEAT repeat domain-containing protein [Planctomycetota bacterium]
MRHLTLTTFLAPLLAAGGLLFLSATTSEAATADYEALANYDFGESRQALSAIEEEIRSLPSTGYHQVESRLLDVLNRPQASFAAKQFVCRMLRRVGSVRCVPEMAELLGDAELSHMARFALQHLPAPEAGAALRAALTTLEGELRVGVIGSLGLREDRSAVDLLAPLVTSKDQDTASAAIKALGRIGGREAAQSLATVNIPAALQAFREDS